MIHVKYKKSPRWWFRNKDLLERGGRRKLYVAKEPIRLDLWTVSIFKRYIVLLHVDNFHCLLQVKKTYWTMWDGSPSTGSDCSILTDFCENCTIIGYNRIILYVKFYHVTTISIYRHICPTKTMFLYCWELAFGWPCNKIVENNRWSANLIRWKRSRCLILWVLAGQEYKWINLTAK